MGFIAGNHLLRKKRSIFVYPFGSIRTHSFIYW